jgi:hypothetical protein
MHMQNVKCFAKGLGVRVRVFSRFEDKGFCKALGFRVLGALGFKGFSPY